MLKIVKRGKNQTELQLISFDPNKLYEITRHIVLCSNLAASSIFVINGVTLPSHTSHLSENRLDEMNSEDQHSVS